MPPFAVPTFRWGGVFVLQGVSMSPRPSLHPDDLVTPSQAARLLRVNPSTVRTWIDRYEIERLGWLGRWPAYDFNAIAAVHALHRKAAA